MPNMSEPRELFLHELGDILYAENVLVKALPKLAQEASDDELRAGFEQHLEETKQHVRNIEMAFEALGEKAKAEKCPGIDGIKAEHDEFMQEEQPSTDVADLFLTGAGARAEHYEIAAYTGLIEKARAMGQSDAAQLLQQNLQEEQQMLQQVEQIAQQMTQQMAAMAGSRSGQQASATM
jgi:ferritin-like metal-binding protein YciE